MHINWKLEKYEAVNMILQPQKFQNLCNYISKETDRTKETAR